MSIMQPMRATILLLAIFSVNLPGLAMAHLHDRPDLDIWISALKAKDGTPCCESSEAVHVADPDWDADGPNGEYRVLIEGEWINVPDVAVIRGPNKYGPTLVWIWHDNGHPKVRCFLPGAGV